MNQKEISAVICGIFLLNGLLTCALGQDVPPDFFIDETRQSSVVIVAGSKAASEDVAFAVLLAAKVGCTCREGPGDIPLTGASTVHENIASLVKGAWASPSPEIESLGFPTVDVPDAGVYKTWEHTTTFYYLHITISVVL